jgi:hypothetical protein
MLLGFKRQFAPYVLNGTKTHTIRAIRKNPPRVGETCHCYVDPRQKTMRLLGRWPCVKIERIYIERGSFSWPLKVWIDGLQLDNSEVEALFRRDGFRGGKRGTGALPGENLRTRFRKGNATFQAAQFWKQRLPFNGQIIHWAWNAPANASKKQRGTKFGSVIASTRAADKSKLTKG